MASILYQNPTKVSMKKLLKISFHSILLLALSLLTSACVKKNPGPGGTAVIKGCIVGQDFSGGELEIQQLTFTNGSQLEHGDYFLLNEVKNGDNYYIYFKNPNWVSPADPGLQGRVGLEIVFNYSDSNVEIAQAVKNKLAALGVLAFNMALDNDILTLTYKNRMPIADPDNGTTNIGIDVVNQGSADVLNSNLVPMAEKRVYLCYGENTTPDDDIKTNSQGEFEFKKLQIGTYKVYVIGETPSISNGHEEVSKTIQITTEKSINDLGTLQIYF